ncbi:sodium-dependent nutrient amino acid transporter 1 isoform X2 [Harpegnathos saltator]|uniref:sodium-dependent nutrient amino acid transporter 1 isoform X2 n=1 Tax=Harpegnathos saltator TaxID=610380 RepID=UPI00058E6235|nr:sodium-dependent nutrient amino acid transporter 1 isoform X2 [Harpegnathos saltator]
MRKDGADNPGFIGDGDCGRSERRNSKGILGTMPNDRKLPLSFSSLEETIVEEKEKKRATWGNDIEFLMSCIAMSVGLGNVWRFPFTAYENGGGAFLIPYIFVLFVVGKPFYYLEMIMGQFTSSSSVKIWSAVPGFRGVGWAQTYSIVAVGTYYCSLMSISLFYLAKSFSSQLPWSTCLEEWGDSCINSSSVDNIIVRHNTTVVLMRSSAELYFTKTVLKEKENIDDGVGLPNWKLTVCLLIVWGCICGLIARGVKSSGKAAYFLAIFPYIVMICLLIRAVTLEGAVNGIVFFIKPDFKKLFEADVWYAAVTQCFFSLSVCFGGVVMYSSHNNFNHNIYRDVIVVTTLDTLTSLLAGFTIFGMLGNLAHELGTDDISSVVRSGTGLAFISYPDAIAKFNVLPQLFSVLFFLMLYVLGIGSAVACIGAINTIICDQFPTWKYWYVVIGTAVIGFLAGNLYCTPGGQFILGLVDFYAGSFIIFFSAALEMIGIFWIYGLENFLDDVEYMLQRRPSIYWRICWAVVTPLLLTGILIYTLINLKPLTYGNIPYPSTAHVAGWTLFTFGVLQIPFWMFYKILSKRNLGLHEMFKAAFRPSSEWGPKNPAHMASWREFKEVMNKKREKRNYSRIKQFIYVIFCLEHKLV